MTGRFRSFTFVFAILALGAGIAAPSSAKNACDTTQLTGVRSLGNLPGPIRRLLPSATRGQSGIADRGGNFNVTDVIDPSLPMRRFTLAGVGSTCALIAIEYGGFVHGFEVAEYGLTTVGWRLRWRRTVVREPSSVADLVEAAP